MSAGSFCLAKIRKSIKHRQLTEAVFSLRVQLLKVAAEPVPSTYATPPFCEQKKKRKKEEREREEEKNRQSREKKEGIR